MKRIGDFRSDDAYFFRLLDPAQTYGMPCQDILPLMTAVPFGREITQILSCLSPKWDCSLKRVMACLIPCVAVGGRESYCMALHGP